MKKVFIYSMVIIGLGASFGSCKLFKGEKDRCPAYTSVAEKATDDLALNK